MSSIQPLIPVGIDLGSLHARVAIGEPMDRNSSSDKKKSVTQLPSIISNAQGSRFTIALSTPEDSSSSAETDDDGGKTKYVIGDAARRQLARAKKPMEEYLVRHSMESTENDDDAAAAFFAHLVELTCDASTHNLAQPSQLRIVLSMPSHASEHLKRRMNMALKKGVRQVVREKEGKKAEKKMAGEVIVGALSDAAAAVLAYGLVDPPPSIPPIVLSTIDSATAAATANLASLSLHSKWNNCLVIDWGASGLSLTHLTSNTTDHTTANPMLVTIQRHHLEPKCAGKLIVSALLSHCATLMERKNPGVIPRGAILKHARAVAKLTTACETAIKTLARTNMAQIAADGVYEGIDLNCTLSKPRFEMLCGTLIKVADHTIKEFTNDSTFDVVLMCGNVCQMPAAEALLVKQFTDDILLRTTSVIRGMKMEVDESVAIGCARCAQQTILALEHQFQDQPLDEEKELSTDETKHMELEVPLSPISIAVQILGGKPHILMDTNTPLPAHVSRKILLDQTCAALAIVQITNDKNSSTTANHKVVAEISDIAPETKELELTLELSEQGQLSMAIDGGETFTV